MIIVSDTSIISNFYQIENLELLRQVYQHLIIPRQVFNELERLSKFGYDTTVFHQSDWMEVKDVSDVSAVSDLKEGLDPGEAEAIILASELHADLLLMDDHKGRLYAESQGLKVIGCAGVLLQAKHEGHINLVKPLLDMLVEQANFWISKAVYRHTLILANE